MIDPRYANLDLHHFRVGRYCILDFPILTTPGTTVWVATLWSHPSDPTTWRRTYWEPGPNGRGWAIDPVAQIGDVIEFGAGHETWIGYLFGADAQTASAVGPCESVGTAAADAGIRTLAIRHQNQ